MVYAKLPTYLLHSSINSIICYTRSLESKQNDLPWIFLSSLSLMNRNGWKAMRWCSFMKCFEWSISVYIATWAQSIQKWYPQKKMFYDKIANVNHTNTNCQSEWRNYSLKILLLSKLTHSTEGFFLIRLWNLYSKIYLYGTVKMRHGILL